jgi:hypothetical protein
MSSVMIHQPEYLPWTGLFTKMAACDIYVHLDSVQYLRRSYQNRNMIKNQHGAQWLTVPLQKAKRIEVIERICIDNSQDWQNIHLSTLRSSYKKAPHFNELMFLLEPIYQQHWELLSDLNITIINMISEKLGFHIDFKRASELNVDGERSERILDICLKCNTSRYISGFGAKAYIDEEEFSKKGIEIVYIPPMDFTYEQIFSERGFIPGLSIIDFLFNCGFKFVAQEIERLSKPYKSEYTGVEGER